MTDFSGLDRSTADALDTAASEVDPERDVGGRDLIALVNAAVVVVESAGVTTSPGAVAWTVARLATPAEWSAIFDRLLVEAVAALLSGD